MADTDGSPVRPGDDPNVDTLIPRTYLYFYASESSIPNIEKQGGILTPDSLLKKYPTHEKHIKSIYGSYLDCKIKRNSVICFFSRIPEIENTKSFLEENQLVKISVGKLKKAKDEFRFFLFGHPKSDLILYPLKPDQLDKLVQLEDKWFHAFRKSTDPYFRDIPQAAILCERGFLPAFACKIINDEDQ